jgi:predicted MFS family arabinose efflux permease
LIASVSDASHPAWRARSLSVYRFWRDMGYAIGALGAGIVADLFGVAAAIASAGALTFISGVAVAVIMRERRHAPTARSPRADQKNPARAVGRLGRDHDM